MGSKKGRPIYVCQVCGAESKEYMQEFPMYDLQVYTEWTIHRVDFVGGWIDLITCVDCDRLSLEAIFEGYKNRIREGLVQGYH